MTTGVLTFGVNHHSAPVDVRERVSMAGDLVLPYLCMVCAPPLVMRSKKPLFYPLVIAQRFTVQLMSPWLRIFPLG